MKFRKHQGGNSYQRGQTTSYMANISIGKLKEAGFFEEESETPAEFEIIVEHHKIILQKIVKD